MVGAWDKLGMMPSSAGPSANDRHSVSSEDEEDDEQSLAMPLAPQTTEGGEERGHVRSRSRPRLLSQGSRKDIPANGGGLEEAMSTRFRRAWSSLPGGLERDPDVAFRNVRLLLGFGALCVFVFLLPTLLTTVSPDAPVVPGSAPQLGDGASTIQGTNGAVAADNGRCSKMGVSVLSDKGGNAVDAAIAVVLCQGVLSPYASGLGGGAFILVHMAANESRAAEQTFLDARETAPKGVDVSKYTHNETASRLGGAAVAIPGELRGLEMAHKRWGSIPWADLVLPVAELAESATVGPMLARRLVQVNETILKSPALSAIFSKEQKLSLLESLVSGDGKPKANLTEEAAPVGASSVSPTTAADAADAPRPAVRLPPLRTSLTLSERTDPGAEPKGGKEDIGSAIASPAAAPAPGTSGIGNDATTAPPSTTGPHRVLLKEGDKLRNPQLVETLKNIATRGADYIYVDLAPELASEVQAAGGTLTAEDLNNYAVKERKPIESFYQGLRVLGGPPPSAGGASIAMALNILEGLHFHRFGRNGPTYVKLAEVLKYVFGMRAKLSDPDFSSAVKNFVKKMLSKRTAMTVRSQMEDGSTTTHDPEHYSPGGVVHAAQREAGTSHVSVVDKYNNAVAITSTINLPFGSGVVSDHTGILFNNQMDDFSTSPDRPNAFGLFPSAVNKVVPGKRPLSSMSPTIILHNNAPYLVVGASGGPRIISATLQAILNVIDFGDILGDALSAPRIHHQLIPNVLWMESVVADSCELYRALKRPSGTSPGGDWSYWPSVCTALKAAEHNVTGPSLDGCVQAVQIKQSVYGKDGVAGPRTILASSDPRKMGLASAY